LHFCRLQGRRFGRHQPPRPRRQDPANPLAIATVPPPSLPRLRGRVREGALVCLYPRQPRRTGLADHRSRRNEVGLSRAALADRFIRLIGTPPMHYLASWRVQVAMQELRNTSASLAQVADMIGYESEAAFSRAFKKAVGTAPATWRRSHG
jgi:hypothetical protein